MPRHVKAMGRGTVFKHALGLGNVPRHALGRGTLPRHVMALGEGTVPTQGTRLNHRAYACIRTRRGPYAWYEAKAQCLGKH